MWCCSEVCKVRWSSVLFFYSFNYQILFSIFFHSFIPAWKLFILSVLWIQQLFIRQQWCCAVVRCCFPLWRRLSLCLSLHQTELIENMKQKKPRHDGEIEAFCAIYLVECFSVSVSSSHLSPAVPVGINFTSQRDDCHLPSGVCLSACPCVLDVATGVKQMDRLLSLLARVYVDIRTHTHSVLLAHQSVRPLSGWLAGM